MTITAQQVQDLRLRTGAGMMDAKKALVDADGDAEKAVELLRKKGLAKADKKTGRQTGEGVIGSYIHGEGKIGVLVEINCESDFVARTDDFKQLVHSVAMHIAAARPRYLSVEEIPAEVIAKETEIYAEQARLSGKPPEVAEKIAVGKLDNFYTEVCLYRQPYIKDPSLTIEEFVKSMIAKLGENIQISRFVCFELGA